jgi:hypothetical protein
MKFWLKIAAFAILYFFPQAHAASKISFSESISASEKALVQKSLASLKERKLNPKQIPLNFKNYFQAKTLKEIEAYLNQRIHLVVSSKSRVWLKTSAPHLTVLPVMMSQGPTATNNPSLLLWLADQWNPEGTPPKEMPKVIQVGEDFGKYSPLFGLSLLVHEARHSDCESSVDTATLSQWKNSATLKDLSFALAKNSCGYSHSLCPEGSANAGKMVCDTSKKGPYAYQYVFNRTIVKSCENCSFAERALMQIFALDAASKLPLSIELRHLVDQTLEQLPALQKNTPPQELIEQVLEKTLHSVDEFLTRS